MKFDGVKVFSATKARDREHLGDRLTDWLDHNPQADVVDTVVTQSSDNEFHCLSITIFFNMTQGEKASSAMAG